jgi:anti-sigma regulatory factor (Ser/Thr protein kinase)
MTPLTTVPVTVSGNRFDHPGLLYHNMDQYLAGTTSFVHSALARGNPVLIAVPDPNLSVLRDALADSADRIRFADMAVAGRNPGRIIPSVLLAFVAAHPGRRVSIIGEPIWPGRSDAEYPACVAHEALINTVFAGADAAILCPYDAASLDQTALDDAWQTHPTMVDDTGYRFNGRYADPLATAARFNVALPPAPPDAVTIAYNDEFDLAAVRRSVAGHATAAGLPDDRVDDLTLAANELTANTIEHTQAGGEITLWADAYHVICQIDDHGHLADPLAGRIPPPPRQEGGRGLILANQLCDLVRIHTSRSGSTIRLYMLR